MHAYLPGGGGGPLRTGPTERAIELVGDRWSLLIVHEALAGGTTRFGDFTRALRIPTNVLTHRLNALVHAGVFERVAAPQGRSPHEYRLTPKGQRLSCVLTALRVWAGDCLPSEE